VGEFVEPSGADQGAGDRHPDVDGLARVGDGAGLDQLDQTVAHHAGMHAEILAVAQQAKNGIGHGADLGLDDGAVLDVGGGVARYGFVGLADLGRRHLDRRARDMRCAPCSPRSCPPTGSRRSPSRRMSGPSLRGSAGVSRTRAC
jgi:hypothetical protein